MPDAWCSARPAMRDSFFDPGERSVASLAAIGRRRAELGRVAEGCSRAFDRGGVA